MKTLQLASALLHGTPKEKERLIKSYQGNYREALIELAVLLEDDQSAVLLATTAPTVGERHDLAPGLAAIGPNWERIKALLEKIKEPETLSLVARCASDFDLPQTKKQWLELAPKIKEPCVEKAKALFKAGLYHEGMQTAKETVELGTHPIQLSSLAMEMESTELMELATKDETFASNWRRMAQMAVKQNPQGACAHWIKTLENPKAALARMEILSAHGDAKNLEKELHAYQIEEGDREENRPAYIGRLANTAAQHSQLECLKLLLKFNTEKNMHPSARNPRNMGFDNAMMPFIQSVSTDCKDPDSLKTVTDFAKGLGASPTHIQTLQQTALERCPLEKLPEMAESLGPEGKGISAKALQARIKKAIYQITSSLSDQSKELLETLEMFERLHGPDEEVGILKACLLGDEEKIDPVRQKIWNPKPEPGPYREEENGPLYLLCAKGHTQCLKKVLAAHQKEGWQWGKILLIGVRLAARNGQAETLQALLDHGAPVEEPDINRWVGWNKASPRCLRIMVKHAASTTLKELSQKPYPAGVGPAAAAQTELQQRMAKRLKGVTKEMEI